MATRVHLLIRFLTCPFLRVVAEIRPGATLLDIGAGHGLFARLALDAGAGRVIAVEPDLRKLRRIDGVECVTGYDDTIRGQHDVISIIDVLYKIPLTEWDSLLGRCFDRLTEGGTLLIKEHDPTARFKNGWNRLQERIASMFRLTLGEAFSYETPADFCRRLERSGFVEVRWQRIDAWYPHPHALYVARRRSSTAGEETARDSAQSDPGETRPSARFRLSTPRLRNDEESGASTGRAARGR